MRDVSEKLDRNQFTREPVFLQKEFFPKAKRLQADG